MEVLQHEHPLTLIDLNPEYPRDEVVYDDEEELIMKQDFRCSCGRCGQEINFYHRYYYTCDQCDYSLHKLCAELSKTLSHESHRDHALILCQVSEDKWCMCHRFDENLWIYKCEKCRFYVHTDCATTSKAASYNALLFNPATPTSSSITTPSSHDSMKMVEVLCNACIRPITNMPFYKCTASDDGCNFVLHVWCTRLSTGVKKKRVVDSQIVTLKLLPPVPFASRVMRTNIFEVDVSCGVTPEFITHKSHPNHLLRRYKPSSEMYCLLCLSDAKTQLFYGCEDCMFYLHTKCALLWPDTIRHKYDKKHPMSLRYFPVENYAGDYFCEVCEEEFNPNIDCATTSKKASMNAIQLNPGTSSVSKNYKDSDYPDLLHLPFHDQTAASKHFYGETTPTSSRITTPSSHDSMKMVEVLCNACIRPITNMPFYKCTASDEGCNFVLHVWCTRLPTEVKMTDNDNVIRTLKLLPPVPFALLGVFRCLCCELFCSGFVYSDADKYSRSSYQADVCCALTPEYITHKSHPNHLLRKLKPSFEKYYCRLCLSDAKTQFFYSCGDCKFYLHPKCALLWPDTIRHKYDKHPMSLRYFPVENYGGDYFCEVCEEEFNPNAAFYHCDQCVYSIHLPCVEFILQEAHSFLTEVFNPNTAFYPTTPFFLDRGVDQYENVKSRIFTFKGHPHPLSLSRSTESDGDCTLCGKHLNNYWIIFKCLQCKFAIDRDCFRKIE
ncbi:B-box-type zinc finger [Artemisia annua]|uniref:B-box-type zinc finger n=1 Tax=Artemisia annua TaxID=35608 RepID=A0A2U1QIV0_ARTAN|nr:B-box-type zinc finger [Artemisia annua]